MSGLSSYEKRLEQVGRTVNHRAAKTIVIRIPTLLTPIEGSVENSSNNVIPPARDRAMGSNSSMRFLTATCNFFRIITAIAPAPNYYHRDASAASLAR
jgi:hypothetical protein